MDHSGNKRIRLNSSLIQNQDGGATSSTKNVKPNDPVSSPIQSTVKTPTTLSSTEGQYFNASNIPSTSNGLPFPISLFNPMMPGNFVPNLLSPMIPINPFLPYPPPLFPPSVGFVPPPWPLPAHLVPPPNLFPHPNFLSRLPNHPSLDGAARFKSSPSPNIKNEFPKQNAYENIKHEVGRRDSRVTNDTKYTSKNIRTFDRSASIKSETERSKRCPYSRNASETNVITQQSSPYPDNKNLIQEIMNTILNKPPKYKRSTPLEPFYKQKPLVIDDQVTNIIESTQESVKLRNKFKQEILERSKRFRDAKPAFSFPKRMIKLKAHKHHHDECGLSCGDSESDLDSDIDSDDNENSSFNELERKKSHPWRLHPELWYNEPGEMNDGLLCRCSLKAQRSGIRHGIYLGEEHLPKCDPNTNNRQRLYHYIISINPKTNFLVDTPTTIDHDGHRYYFEGYSMFSHFPIPSSFPACKIIRYNVEYSITFFEDDFPQNFCIEDLDLVFDYIFYELLELVDFNLKAKYDDDGCYRFHFMPRFVRLSENDGKELLSMSLVLDYLLRSSKVLIEESLLEHYSQMETHQWNDFAKQHKGYIVTCPSMKPCSLRVDQIDREKDDVLDSKSNEKSSSSSSSSSKSSKANNHDDLDDRFPVIVHFGIRPPQLSYAGNTKYQKAWRDYVKYRHLLANKEKVTYQDKQVLMQKEERLQEMRSKSDLKRDVTVVVGSRNFYSTGLQCDIVQHSLIIPVLVSHLRFHYSLQHLEKIINYTFNDRSLLQLSLTHPSYRENFGTNPDHARNTLTNCGLRFLEYGDRKVHFMNTRKRGINMLINIMSRFGCNEETVSNINHNERLEFLGDAVVEFLTSIHLYFLFPDLEEGGLATYRAALVQNQHLAVMAKKLQLEKFMLYAHGSDLCHDLELRHAMANCFEAFMGALFLDGGIEIADQIFSSTLFDGGGGGGDNNNDESKRLHDIWINYPEHPLQTQYPDGDRHFIETIPRLKELTKFEDMTGIQFKHIRLLARAFTHRSVGYNELTLGSNQRMEFLGDTVLQLIASEYLYKHFPDHHEGHLSLLRSSLVNNKTQSVVCDDLGIIDMTQYNSIKSELKTKDRADLLEAFIGALYVDKRIEYCRTFCEVCFFPRLEQFITNQDWNDPKSKLQQCCLTLRSVDCGEPDIPTYKVIDSKGPTNTRIYEVAVYFRDNRLATGKGHSIQEAEMNAATNALRNSKELFPHLQLQRKVIQRNIRTFRDRDFDEDSSSS